ncbi:MAG: hypothetical protein NG747_10500 [Candidatus Brocadia sp.]|nr:hypothetical protein [Candidatus Brocadia sp.]
MSSYSNELAPWERKSAYYSVIQLGKDVKTQTKTISKQTQELVATQMESTSEIISSQERIQERISEGIDNVAYGIERVADGLYGLGAAFEWGISEVVWQIEQNRKVLKDILAVLMAPLDTQAKELRRRAEDAYANGWFEEALEDFLESEKKNRYDFIVHISIGMIYLFQKIDKEKALDYFEKAIKYAKPTSPYHASYALLYKALIKRDLGLIEEAEACTGEAVELCPDFAEALYQNALYNALLNKPEKAIPLIRKVIEMDVNYCLKICNEKDFGNIRTRINALNVELRDKQREKAQYWYGVLANKLEILNDLMDEVKDDFVKINNEEVAHCSKRITELIRRNTYFDCIEANDALDKLSVMIQKLCSDTKTLLEKNIGYYYSNIRNIEYNIEKRTEKRLENIGYVWSGIPISFILGIIGCVASLGKSAKSGFLSTFGPPLVGSIITVITYFVLRSSIKSSGKRKTPEIISDESLIERLRDISKKLEKIQT